MQPKEIQDHRRFAGWLSAALLAAGMCGCGAGSDRFVGKWVCTNAWTTTFTAPAGMPASMEAPNPTVTISDDGKGNLTLVMMPSDGSPPCTTHAQANAAFDQFNYTPGQSCKDKQGNTFTFTSVIGMLEVDVGITYFTTDNWTFSGSNGSMGTGTGMSRCDRQ
jgi:hypothetical protein